MNQCVNTGLKLRGFLVAAISLFAASLTPLLGQEPAPPAPSPHSLLANSSIEFDEIVFAQRVSGRDHWYGNFGHYCDDSPYTNAALLQRDGRRFAFGEGARLCRFNLRTGKLHVLLNDPRGGIRDPNVHYDATKILFSYRPGDSEAYHLYEINVDGSGLRQLTDGEDNDIEPVYLPDGDIMFCSSRCHRLFPAGGLRLPCSTDVTATVRTSACFRTMPSRRTHPGSYPTAASCLCGGSMLIGTN